jgi:23S rRNA (uracil1939-C5)-methyltransferase
MSCNPKTFAQDAAQLLQSGFEMGDVFAHDMLPCTAHVEVIARFARRLPK